MTTNAKLMLCAVAVMAAAASLGTSPVRGLAVPVREARTIWGGTSCESVPPINPNSTTYCEGCDTPRTEQILCPDPEGFDVAYWSCIDDTEVDADDDCGYPLNTADACFGS